MLYERTSLLDSTSPDIPDHLKGTRAALFRLLREQSNPERNKANPVKRLKPVRQKPNARNAPSSLKEPNWRDVLLEDMFVFNIS